MPQSTTSLLYFTPNSLYLLNPYAPDALAAARFCSIGRLLAVQSLIYFLAEIAGRA